LIEDELVSELTKVTAVIRSISIEENQI